MWRTSSFSFSNGNCIEVNDVDDDDWRTSTKSESGNCVEVKTGIAVRDTKNRDGATLRFTSVSWQRFLDNIK
jgi:hypothetical protein